MESLDLSLAALFLWINLIFAALSSAEKAFDKFLPFGWRLNVLISFLSAVSRARLRAVLVLSFRIFLMAEAIIGIDRW